MPYYHVRITQKSNQWHDEVRLDLTLDRLEHLILEPYRKGVPITTGGKSISTDDIERLRITETTQDSTYLRPAAEVEQRRSMIIPPISVQWYIADMGKDISDEFITGPPGSERGETATSEATLSISASSSAQENARTFLDRFDETVTSDVIRSTSRQLFTDGHYSRAVEEAFKRLNNEVKAMSGFEELDGDKLMRQAFSANNPKLHLNSLSTISQKDEQRGYMDIFAGAMTGVRNPRAHDHELVDEPEVALELLVLANHLMRKLESSTKE